MGNDVTKFLIAPYDVYVGATNPTDGEGLTLASGIPSGGSAIGITDGELSFKYTPSITEIKGVQGNGILNVFLSDEDAEFSFNFKQVQDFALLDKILMGSLPFSDTGKTPDQSLIGLGGLNEIPSSKLTAWTFVAKLPFQDDDYYFYIHAYQAVATADLSLAIAKDKESVVAVTLKPIAQLDRTPGRQIVLIGKEKA